MRLCRLLYTLAAKKKWRCKSCTYDFSVTSGTVFTDRKMSFSDLLLAIYKFVNAAKGLPALELSRELVCDYGTALVLLHKLRTCIEADSEGKQVGGPDTTVEVDGAYFGGHIAPENKKEDRVDRRKAENQNGKRQCLGVIRQRGGLTVATVVADEAALVPVILRRAEIGIYHHVSGKYLQGYATEMAWREDRRRQGNGSLMNQMATLAMLHGPSAEWRGYDRNAKAAN